MAWWRRKSKRNGAEGQEGEPSVSGTSPSPIWREATANPFGIRVLDLTPTTRGLTAWSGNPACAKKAISWAGSTGSELDSTDLGGVSPIRCELRYPVAPVFADGLLFVPSGMEDKWVLAHRGQELMAARSWTGIVDVVAQSRREDDVLLVSELRVRPGSTLQQFSDIVPIFDWLIRSHALGQALPLPVDDDALAHLEESPLDAFSAFGQRAFCAARSGTGWPPPPHPLWTDGAVLHAVREANVERVRSLHRSGEPIDAPTTFEGNTPLTIAVIRGDIEMVRALLELGANPRARSFRGNFPLGYAIVHGAPTELLDALLAGGASPYEVNDDGFGLLHAAAEVDCASAIPWLMAKSLDIEARTRKGHTPLQIACGLGRLQVARALLEAGANARAPSSDGTAREIAARAQKQGVLKLLDELVPKEGR